MFRVVRKQVRPNTTVSFFSMPQETLAWVNQNYIQTGKMQSPVFSVSDNGLELTITTDWVSSEENQAFRENAYVVNNVLNTMRTYCDANGIELSITEEAV
jgi:hypothetical protein